MRRTLWRNTIFDHSDGVGASPVVAAQLHPYTVMLCWIKVSLSIELRLSCSNPSIFSWTVVCFQSNRLVLPNFDCIMTQWPNKLRDSGEIRLAQLCHYVVKRWWYYVSCFMVPANDKWEIFCNREQWYRGHGKQCCPLCLVMHHNYFECPLNRPRQNGRHFPDDIFKCIFLNVNAWISIKISLKFVPKVPINKNSSLVQIMAWRRSGDKPLSEPMMVSLLTHICVTRPQWVKDH